MPGKEGVVIASEDATESDNRGRAEGREVGSARKYCNQLEMNGVVTRWAQNVLWKIGDGGSGERGHIGGCWTFRSGEEGR